MKNQKIQTRSALAAMLLLACAALQAPVASAQATPTARGAVVQTPRLSLEIVDGVVIKLTNKLTGESYLRPNVDPAALRATVPAGLGTVNGKDARESAKTLFRWPWNEMAPGFKLPNQHAPTSDSKFQFIQKGDGAELLYTGLFNGDSAFGDETFKLVIEIDPKSSDILITPTGSSAAAGLYGTVLLVAPTARHVSIEAPIFDGVKLTPDMKTNLWINLSPSHWDYPLIAFNGDEAGAIGVWAQDKDRRFKTLFYQGDGHGLTTAFGTLENSPFGPNKEATGVAWRFQAFDKGWQQVSARYRDWRDANLQIAPRPEWTKHVAFVNSGVNASKGWLDTLVAYLGNQHLDRSITFMPVIRAAAFDTKHWDNNPYPKFKSETPAWKAAGAKTLPYLQPMIVWGSLGSDASDEDKRVMAMHNDADTKFAFNDPISNEPLVDQHHLGHAGWQAWFLNWVKRYIQECGADGVYHDQSYATPIDGRGLINGMSVPQGMADYFYKAATQNPDSIHATEHLQEANIAGASLGIGSGVLWGTAPTMRLQRIHHGSPISNSLHYPYGVIFGFPHYSDLGTHRDVRMYHWGMDLMERRGEIAGLALQGTSYVGPYDFWVNEAKLDRDRSLTFVGLGLRPVFPIDWDPSVRTYFNGANGEDVRYINTDFGSEFVRYEQGKPIAMSARLTGVTHAKTPLSVSGWVYYNQDGPSGLHPERYYAANASAKRPDVYFSPGFAVVPGAPLVDSMYEGYVNDGAANDWFIYMLTNSIDSVGKITRYDRTRLHASTDPAAVYVNGQPAKARHLPTGEYEIGLEIPTDVVVFLKPVPPGLEGVEKRTLLRAVGGDNCDLADSAYLSATLVSKPTKPAQGTPGIEISSPFSSGIPGVSRWQMHIPLAAPADRPANYLVHLPPNTELSINGQVQKTAVGNVPVAIKVGQSVLVSIVGPAKTSVILEEVAPAQPAAVPATPAPTPATKPAK